jgi:hypothetical protein
LNDIDNKSERGSDSPISCDKHQGACCTSGTVEVKHPTV